MRSKLFVSLLAFAVFAMVAGSVFADGLPRAADRRIEIYTVVVTTGSTNNTVVPAGTITPDDRILGYSIVTTQSSYPAMASFYDTTTVALATTTTIFAETAEVLAQGNAGSKETVWFPYPYKVDNQLVIRTGDTGSVISVFYEDVSAGY